MTIPRIYRKDMFLQRTDQPRTWKLEKVRKENIKTQNKSVTPMLWFHKSSNDIDVWWNLLLYLLQSWHCNWSTVSSRMKPFLWTFQKMSWVILTYKTYRFNVITFSHAMRKLLSKRFLVYFFPSENHEEITIAIRLKGYII